MRVKTVIIIEGLSDLAMMAAKLAVGIVTNSTAIIGDALHSLTDLANNIISLIAISISEKPADDDHHYGHRKFEQLAVFTLAVLLAVVAVELIFNAIRHYGQVVEQSFVGLVVMITVLTINLGLTIWQHYWAKRLNSDLIKADAKHTLSDALTTVAIIIGWQLAARGHYWLDTVFTFLVAGIILYMAFHLFTSAIPILVDHSRHNQADIERVIQNIDRVREVRQIRTRSTAEGGWADVVISVDQTLSTQTSHRVTEEIEQAMEKYFGIKDVIVHVEPQGDLSD